MYSVKKLKYCTILALAGVIPVSLLYFSAYFLNYYTLIGPFCSTAALIIANPNSNFCNPKNILGGYFITIFLVIFSANFLNDHNLFVFLIIFSLSIFLMSLIDAFHPSATAVTIVEFFVTNNPDQMTFYAFTSTILMCIFAYFYRIIHKRFIA